MNFKESLEAAIEENQERHTLWIIEDIEWDDEPKEIENEILDTTRWETIHRAVYKHDGRFWAVVYTEGSTEYQDSNSYGTEVYEVEPAQKTITYYRKLT